LLPVAVPSIFAGLRLGLVYSLLGVVTGELIASQHGLGALVVYYSAVFNITGIYAILLVLAVIASVLNMAMVAGERSLLRWQPPSDR
jgi:NitT/TauT family transport system permease protein